MADHWKSLANMLGAPGIDSPAKPTPAPESEPKSETQEEKLAEEPAFDVGDEEEVVADVAPPEEDSVVEVAAEASGDDDSSLDGQSSEELEAIVDEVVEVVEDANGDDASDVEEDSASEATGADSPSESEEESGEPSLSFKSLSKPAPKASDAEPKQDDGAAVISALGTKAKGKPAEKPDKSKRAKPKRKTSWDTLAGMFGLGSSAADDTESVDDGDEGLDADSTGEAPSAELSLFDENESSDENSALEAMFPEASGDSKDSWASKRRVVNDVDWDDDDYPKSKDAKEPVAQADASESTQELSFSSGDKEDEESDTRSSKSRRRRGRGRGRRDQERDSRPSDNGGDDEWHAPRDDRESQNRSSSDSDIGWDEPESFEADSEDGVEVEAERRSNRRRKRGRNRRSEGDDRREEFADSEPTGRSRRDADDRDEEDSRDDRYEARKKRGPSDERDEEPRRRRRKRPDSRKSNSEEGADQDESAAPKHRNIPTWTDALDALVENNIENHKKVESRGSSRGRSRGRR